MGMEMYEAGAVAALGITWSLRRLQNKWEGARTFWEGEVREEGRRAVRATEGAVGGVLVERPVGDVEGKAELDAARKAVQRAEEALERSRR